MENTEENPFSALLADSTTERGINKELVETIFLFTLRKTSPSGKILLSLADIIVQDTGNEETMGEELLSHAIFERLMLTDTKEYLISGGSSQGAGASIKSKEEEDALDPGAISYLYRAFVTCQAEKLKNPELAQDCDKICTLILTNVSTCMRQPELFQGQSLPLQWLKIFQNAESVDITLQEFLVQTVNKMTADDDQIEVIGTLKAIFYPMFNELQKQIINANIITLKKNIFWILGYFVKDKRAPQLGDVLIDYTTPNPNSSGRWFFSLNFCIIKPLESTYPYRIENNNS